VKPPFVVPDRPSSSDARRARAMAPLLTSCGNAYRRPASRCSPTPLLCRRCGLHNEGPPSRPGRLLHRTMWRRRDRTRPAVPPFATDALTAAADKHSGQPLDLSSPTRTYARTCSSSHATRRSAISFFFFGLLIQTRIYIAQQPRSGRSQPTTGARRRGAPRAWPIRIHRPAAPAPRSNHAREP